MKLWKLQIYYLVFFFSILIFMSILCTPCKDRKLTISEIVGVYTAKHKVYKGRMVINSDNTYTQKIWEIDSGKLVYESHLQKWTFDFNQKPQCYGSITAFRIEFYNGWNFETNDNRYLSILYEIGWKRNRIPISGPLEYWEKQD